MFAATAGMLIVASSLPVSVLGAASYSDELQGAYNYAYSKGITTMSSIDNANMYGELTRGQLAKMISNWAEKELGTKADETKVCSFADAQTAEGDLAAYVKKACQMGLMGQGIDKFRPRDKVTRGEFGTTLSRAIWGTKYDGATPYYANHLQALKDKGIMTKIENPSQMEIRGYVMLMLQRTSNTEKGAKCNDPLVTLACTMGSATCPAECKKSVNTGDVATGSSIDGMAIAGDLNVGVADFASEVKSAPATGTVIFNTVELKGSEKITLESIKLERTGLSDKSAIKGVWFEKDGVAVSARASVTTDGTVTTRFYKGFSVNGTEKLDLVVELAGIPGSEIAFKFVDVKSTAKNLSFGTATTTKYRTAAYNVAKLKFDATHWSSVNYKLGEKKDYEFGRFTLTNETASTEDKDVVLKSLKLRNYWSADLALVLKNVRVLRDNKVVSKKVELGNREMVVYFDDTLASGKKGVYTIMAEIAQLDRVDDKVQFELRKSTELVGYEKNSNFRVAYSEPQGALLGTEYVIKGGKLVFITKTGFPKVVEAAASSTDVEIANGTFNVSEPVKLERFKVKLNGTTNAVATDVIKNLKLEIGGSTYTSKETPNASSEYEFTDDIYVSKNSEVKLLVNLKPTATLNNRVKFDNIKASAFDRGSYENSDNGFTPSSEIAGVITVADLVVKTPTFSITNKATGTAKVVKGNSDRVVIFDGEITTNKDKVSVNELGLRGTFSAGPLGANDQIDLSLSVNGQPAGDGTFKNNVVKFNSLGDVEKGKAMKLKIEAQPSVDVVGHITFSLTATGSDSQSNETVANPTNALKLEIVSSSDIAISNSAATSTVEVASSNAQLLKFSSRIRNGAATLTGIVLSGASSTSFDSLTGKRVTATFNNGTTVQSEPIVEGSGNVVFSGLNETLQEGNVDITFTVDVNADNAPNGLAVEIKEVGMYYDGKVATKGNLGVKYLFTKVKPLVSLKSNTNNELVVEITNPRDSQYDITLTGYQVKSVTELPSSASLNGQNIALATTAAMTGITSNQVTLNPGESTLLRLGVSNDTNHKATQLAGIQIYFEDGNNHYSYDITDIYTNVANWADLRAVYKS